MEKKVLCRLCASEGNAAADMILLYDESMECIALRQKIEKHTPVKVFTCNCIVMCIYFFIKSAF